MDCKPKGILKNSFSDESDLSSSPGSANAVGESNEQKLKKSVKFSSHVSCNFYRSNSSILGQRKKNQRKARKKKKSCPLSKYQAFDSGNEGTQHLGDSEESSASEFDSLASSPTTDAILPFYGSHLVPVNNFTNSLTMQENVLNDNISFSDKEIQCTTRICDNDDSNIELNEASLTFGKKPVAFKKCVLSTDALASSLNLLTLEDQWYKHFNVNICSFNWMENYEHEHKSLFDENKSNLILSEYDSELYTVSNSKAVSNSNVVEHAPLKCADSVIGAIDLSFADANNSSGDIRMLEYPTNSDNEKNDSWNNSNDREFSELNVFYDEESVCPDDFIDIEHIHQMYDADKKSFK